MVMTQQVRHSSELAFVVELFCFAFILLPSARTLALH